MERGESPGKEPAAKETAQDKVSTAREILDPNHILPEVELYVFSTQELGHFTREQIALRSKGKDIGRCDLIIEHGKRVHFDGLEIDSDERGKGLGLATYLSAIEKARELGLPFESQDTSQTKDAKRIWEKLAAFGIATEIEPFEFTHKISGEPRYKGKYRVN